MKDIQSSSLLTLVLKLQRMSLAFGADAMPTLPAWLADMQSKGVGGAPKEEKDLRWVSDFVDKLAVAIAQREWEEAVALIEQSGWIRLTTDLLLQEG